MESSSKSTDGMDVDKEIPVTQMDDQQADALSIVPQPRASSEPLKYPDFAVGYVYACEMMAHFSPQRHHPEQPQRIQKIWMTLHIQQLTEKMKWIPIREVKRNEILLVHSEDHWNRVIALKHLTEQQRADTEEYYEQLSLYVMPSTTRAALLSCGGVVEACLAVARGELRKSFAIVRPPGHHAEPDNHMGFCFFNNVAVAARVVQQRTKIRRVLILDWDVHHGNGTQRAFNDDPSVLYMSIHRYERGTFYPTGPFGSMESCGEGDGIGYSVNVPWPEKGMGDSEYIYAFQKVIMPIALEFAPELVIISAGFDAAEGDDLGECFVTPAGYAHMTHMLSGLAGGRVAVALEGGYNLDSISNSALAVTRVLLGEPPAELPILQANEAATETVWLVAREQSKYWKSVDPKACEPREDVEQVTFSIPEILKAHRQYDLFTTWNMMQIPFMYPELEDRFSTQALCSEDLFTNKTLVLFAHEFGNLRMELESSATCDVHLERSYLIDFSKDLLHWVKKHNYAILDVNLFPKPSESPLSRKLQAGDVSRDVLVYLWDNYVQLSGAENIIILGHGPGCRPLVDLVNQRAASVTRSVKAFIQVLGPQRVPTSPKDPEARAWYHKCSLLIVPSIHPTLTPNMRSRDLRRHGTIVTVDESRQVKLISRALPAIKEFVDSALANPPSNT